MLCHLGRCLQEGSIGGVETYFAEPSSPPKGGIMLLQDIHGWKSKNIRLVADKYADAGMHLVCSCTCRCSSMPTSKYRISQGKPHLTASGAVNKDTVLP